MLTKLFLLTGTAIVLLFSSNAFAQKNKNAAPVGPLLTRTVSRHEVRRFGYGSTITILGAPRGSITIEGWTKNEVDISAEIEVQGATEEDMARVAAVIGFILDDEVNHLSLITTGLHDKSYMKRTAKNFPKQLLGSPWKIDYRLRVPIATDLELNGGVGPISVTNVEGSLRLNAPQTDATLNLTGRTANLTVGAGTVNVIIPARSWRGSGIDVQLAAGKINVELQPGFSGDIDADILRSGKIEDSFGLEARDRSPISATSLHGRAGVGGAFLKFSVGIGEIHIKKSSGQ